MSVKEIITQVRHLLAEQIDESILLAWLNQFEMTVQMQVFGIARSDAVQYTRDTWEASPTVQGHYARVYRYYLMARGHAQLKNQSGYDRFRRLYESEYAAYRKFITRTHGTPTEQTGGQGCVISAYGIAQKHGFTGSEAEWLSSLRGADGQNGKDGAPGAQGERGEAGPQGEKGDRGEKGEKGDRGDIGPQGEKGDRGEKGEKGDRGDIGPQGEKGDRGEKGEKGDRGDIGPQGPAGRDGADGKDAVSLQYDLQYNPNTHVLQLLCNGTVVRSFDLTQDSDVQELLGVLDANGANLLDAEGAVILPAAARESN